MSTRRAIPVANPEIQSVSIWVGANFGVWPLCPLAMRGAKKGALRRVKEWIS